MDLSLFLLQARSTHLIPSLNTNFDWGRTLAVSPILYTALLFIFLRILYLILASLPLFRMPRSTSLNFLDRLREKLEEKNFDQALDLCQSKSYFSSSLIATALGTRQHGPQVMLHAILAEGKRCTDPFLRKIMPLKTFALITPLIGLLGSMMALFYAYSEVSRSQESLSSIFQKIPLALGPALCGTFVSLLALLSYKVLKNKVEYLKKEAQAEALSLGAIIDPNLRNFEV